MSYHVASYLHSNYAWKLLHSPHHLQERIYLGSVVSFSRFLLPFGRPPNLPLRREEADFLAVFMRPRIPAALLRIYLSDWLLSTISSSAYKKPEGGKSPPGVSRFGFLERVLHLGCRCCLRGPRRCGDHLTTGHLLAPRLGVIRLRNSHLLSELGGRLGL